MGREEIVAELKKVYRRERRWIVVRGDCLSVLKALPDGRADAVVTDPPAGISFMGRAWDHHKGGRDQWTAWLAEVMRECLRVLKPGGHCIVWALPRTAHWTTTAVEDAGFEIRDAGPLFHVFGQGFPKSLDVSKAIDKAAGAPREVVGVDAARAGRLVNQRADYASPNGWSAGNRSADVTAPATDAARRWSGWGTALKPSVELWVVARKPLDGTVVQNVLKHGAGGINVGGCRVATSDDLNGGAYAAAGAARHDDTANWRYKHGGAGEYAQPDGRWPPHALFAHAPGCARVGTKQLRGDPRGEMNGRRPSGFVNTGADSGEEGPCARVYGDERVPEYACVPGCPVAALDAQSGVLKSGRLTAENQRDGGFKGTKNCFGKADAGGSNDYDENSGGASRFFPQFEPDAPFFYCAKAPGRERNRGVEDWCWRRTKGGLVRIDRAEWETLPPKERAEGNAHVSVKPVKLMRWLVRLVTPPGGVVVDPFAGSGTTGVAAIQEGFRFLGVDEDRAHCEIARARIEAACKG